MPAVPLAQLSIPPDLIGPLIFGLVFLGSWIWGGYKKAVKRREARRLKEAAYEGRAAPVEDRPGGVAAEPEPRRQAEPAVASAAGGTGGRGGGMSMRERIERARAEAAAGGRSDRPSTPGASAEGRPAPRRPRPQPQHQQQPQPQPQRQPQRPLPDFVVREEPARTVPVRRPPPPPPAPRPRPVARPRTEPAAAPKLRVVAVEQLAPAASIAVRGPLQRDDLRHAIVMAELLRSPVALRGPDER
ncbi:hypothetical protein [Phycisphaera mikurensis]|uniref:Uncharacterized protein n=1 Tax=Phycisphaera mikurensis (strain NBRC 102666 / KCTC 22515 / FYK2301M01) TaxID=1142394 RepID=I0IGU5_PHYMF|nr:hypothetical protein [Phycisphaera mikurensis]MBB6440740.1 hypothetical protein [Phycisphaera mikurensis]BAM04483.1 hypothetical protein PSMK_23240 [Phycisphaera mikurensis NBRC 102666]